MEVSASQGWCELSRNGENECPKLFYSIDLQHDGFDLSFTDLVAIWRCSMNKSQILATAKTQHTSIDPSESSSQFQVLLHKLEQSLKSKNNSLSHDDKPGSQVVYLHTYLSLPRPLQPLKWTFKLVPQNAAELGEQLLQPSLMEAAISKQKLKALYQIIKDKDHVISRLLEKLEGSSTDLSLVFPGVKPRKGRLTAVEAEKHVPGMGAFDLASWSSRFEETNLYKNYNSNGFENLVAGCQRCPKHNSHQHSKWINNLPELGQNQPAEQSSPQQTHQPNDFDPEPLAVDVGSSDDEFERQSTPPHLRKRLKQSDSGFSAASSETDQYARTETPLGTKPAHRAKSDAKTLYPKFPKDLQRSGKKNSKHWPPEINDSETASEEDDLDSSDRARTKISHSPKRNQSSQSDDATTESDASNTTSPEIGKAQTRKHKLGGIGKRNIQHLAKDFVDEQPTPINNASSKRDHAKVDRQPSDTSSDQQSQAINDHKLQNTLESNAFQGARRQLGRLNKKPTAVDNASSQMSASVNNEAGVSPTRSHEMTHDQRVHISTLSKQASPKIGARSSSQSNEDKTTAEIKDELVEEEGAKSIPDHIKSGSKHTHSQESDHLTVEEKANQRREELKRKVDTGSGVRKKRKF